jgi:hypothetical protein
MVLRDCLYVQCVVCLICPRQIGAETKNPVDGFNATYETPILTVQVKRTTNQYDKLSNLPLLYTKPGITSYINYSHSLSAHISSQASTNNLTKKQHQKLHLHELCAHEGFWNLNRWIRQG